MRWLVTGGLGFIGSNFIRLVLRERPGVQIVNLDAMTYAGNPANLATVAHEPRYRFLHGSICDAGAVARAAADGVDAMINFAAETHVDRSIAEPRGFLETDGLGTLTLLEAARTVRPDRFIQVSTDEVYGHVPVGESMEDDAVRPRSPYAASKAAGDLLALAYHATYDVPTVITRGCNTYGPYQFPEKIVPLFVTNLLDDRPVPLYGDGGQIRDWLYVDDHARAVLVALENGRSGNIYNVGAGNPRTNYELTQVLVEGCGRSEKSHIAYVADRPGHDRRYAVNSAKLRALGWQPRVSFDEGIARTIDWYRDNESWWRPLKVSQ